MADRRLRVFHAVAKQLSFTKAADSLCMTQPSVTAQVKQLEEHFGTRLFDRTSGRISLTPAGAVALEYAERILALDAELEKRLKDLSGKEHGPLLIGASTTIAEYLLPRILGEFKAAHGAVIPRLFVGTSDAVQNRVAERALDLGFIEGDTPLATLSSDVCAQDELQVVCAPSHPFAQLKEVTPPMLSEHPHVSREPGSGTREVIGKYLHKAGIAPDSLEVVMEASSPESLKGFVATGMAYSILSRATVTSELANGSLVCVPLAPPLIRNLLVVYPKERMHSKLVNAFLQFAKERLAASGARSGRSPPARLAQAR